MPNCKQCNIGFEITKGDMAFYDKISPVINGKKYLIPPPTFCPDCRQQRRLSYRNEKSLFKRKCDLCKRDMVSFFSEKEPFPVYCGDCWWSDKWDPLKYGREFDFSRPFFPQFHDLLMQTPKAGMLSLSNENSEYNNLVAYSKNTYMSHGSYYLEDCFYARKSQYCKDCLNSNFLDHCELTTDSINCKKCFNCSNLVNCKNCTDSHYLADCNGCKNCFMCSGLANKEYHFKNKPITKEELERIQNEAFQMNQDKLAQAFTEFSKTIPKKYQNQISCVDSMGDYIQNCKNAVECYDCFDIEDSKYVVESVDVKDSMDQSMHDKQIELCYENCSGGEKEFNSSFTFCSSNCTNSNYLYSCFFLDSCFGCDSIHLKLKNCILNKQYSPDDYENLKARIIEHMTSTGEWGEFFPVSISLYSFNQTSAQDYHPVSKEEALKRGYKWTDADARDYRPATVQLPDDINVIPDTITNELLACVSCKKNYRILAQELSLSKKLGIPLSKYCPDCRQQKLMNLKNPRKLWDRKCAKCNAGIKTTYAPEQPEEVYCDSCYLREVY